MISIDHSEDMDLTGPGIFMVDDERSDLKFVVLGKKIPAHKLIVKTNSEYFNTMLSPPFKEATQLEVELKDIPSIASFRVILWYLYSGIVEISVNDTTATDAQILANKYLLTRLEADLSDSLFNKETKNNIEKIWEMFKSSEQMCEQYEGYEEYEDWQYWTDYTKYRDSQMTDAPAKNMISIDHSKDMVVTGPGICMVNDERSDIKLVVLGKTIPAHKLILMSNSEYFKKMFEESTQLEIELADIPSNELFRVILTYLYTGKVEIPLNYTLASDVYILANKYGFSRLKTELKAFSKGVNGDNILAVYMMATTLNMYQLKADCQNYVIELSNKLTLENVKKIYEMSKAERLDQLKDKICQYLKGGTHNDNSTPIVLNMHELMLVMGLEEVTKRCLKYIDEHEEWLTKPENLRDIHGNTKSILENYKFTWDERSVYKMFSRWSKQDCDSDLHELKSCLRLGLISWKHIDKVNPKGRMLTMKDMHIARYHPEAFELRKFPREMPLWKLLVDLFIASLRSLKRTFRNVMEETS